MTLRFESGTHLQLFQLCWIHFEPNVLGSCTNIPGQSTCSSLFSPDHEPPRRVFAAAPGWPEVFNGGTSQGVHVACKAIAFEHGWFDSSTADHFEPLNESYYAKSLSFVLLLVSASYDAPFYRT